MGLALLDIRISDGTGTEIGEELRSRGLIAPRITGTTDCSAQALESYLAAGCNSHLGMPVDAELLHGALAMHLATAE